MKRTKTHRRRCAHKPCGKQFRHDSPRAKYCRDAHKSAAYRERKRERMRTEPPKLTGKYARYAEHLREQERELQEQQRMARIAPTAPSRTTPAADRSPARDRDFPSDTSGGSITITVPQRFPGTPLPRGYRNW